MEGKMGGYPEGPKGWIVNRYKLGWRFLCISNLALGAYIFSKTPKKAKTSKANKGETEAPAEPVVENSTTPKEDIVGSPPISESVIERQPVIAREHGAEREPYQQREPFKWMEEKMKTKERIYEEKERIDREKKRIDEEKALLEQYIRKLGFSAHISEPKVDKTIVASKVETKSLTEHGPVMQHGFVLQREPMTEDEPVMEHESVTQHEPVKECMPMTEGEPVIQHKLVMEHEPVIERGPVTEQELIPPYQQQELFKWMLEEKMKTEPSNQEEEKRIHEEKALLENYICALNFSSQMIIPNKEKTVVASKVETEAPSEDTKFSPSNLNHDM